MSYLKKQEQKKAIASARAFLGDEFEKIIIMCGLQQLNSWKEWEDNYGNKLKINNNKIIKIIKNDKVSTIKDIYAKSSFELISKFSYWVMVLLDINKNCIFWFLGNDGILRCISFIDNIKTNNYPLLSGYKILNTIANLYTCDFDIINNVDSIDFAPRFKTSIGYVITDPLDNEIFKKIIKETEID